MVFFSLFDFVLVVVVSEQQEKVVLINHDNDDQDCNDVNEESHPSILGIAYIMLGAFLFSVMFLISETHERYKSIYIGILIIPWFKFYYLFSVYFGLGTNNNKNKNNNEIQQQQQQQQVLLQQEQAQQQTTMTMICHHHHHCHHL